MKINGFLEDNREICISDDKMYDTQLNYVGFNSQAKGPAGFQVADTTSGSDSRAKSLYQKLGR